MQSVVPHFNRNLLKKFVKIPKISPLQAQLFHEDERTDAFGRFSQLFLSTAPRIVNKNINKAGHLVTCRTSCPIHSVPPNAQLLLTDSCLKSLLLTTGCNWQHVYWQRIWRHAMSIDIFSTGSRHV